MTTIVTTHSPEYTAMYADEGITSDYIHPDMNKIIRKKSWLIGVCGGDRVCDVLQYVVKYPDPPQYLSEDSDEAWLSWVVNRIVPEINKAIDKHLPKSYKDNMGESQILLVTHGRSFLIADTLGVTKAQPYWSIGSGFALALGYLASVSHSKDWEPNHSTYAKKAVETAQKHDPFTRGTIRGYASYKDGSVKEL